MKKNFMKSLTVGVMACAAFAMVSCGGEKKAAEGEATEAAETEAAADPNARKAIEKPADLLMLKEVGPAMQITAANVGMSTEPCEEMAKGNKSIENVYIFGKIGIIGTSAFQNCTNLKNVYSDNEILVFGDYSFAGCTSLTSLDANTYTIGEHAFEGCTSLQTVKLANLPQMDIREKAFAGCTSLKTVLLGLEEDQIKEDAFAGCTALEEVAVPYNRKDNIYAIISDSKQINKLYILTPAFYPYPSKSAAKAFNKAQCEVYIPDALIDDFKMDPNWMAFKAIKPLSESGYYDAKCELK